MIFVNMIIRSCISIIMYYRHVSTIESLIDISNYWPLFLVSISVISEQCNQYCKKCTNNVISSDYSIINCFYDTHNY